jgi:hypothetical protein
MTIEKSSSKPVAESKPTSMSRKDFLSLVVSGCALAVSAATFGLSRREKAAERSKVRRRQAYEAFQLGKRFGSAFWMYVLTREGDQDEVAATREKALDFARQAEPYATTLDLRIQLDSLISRYDFKAKSQIEDPYTTLTTRLVGTVGQDVSDKFSVAYWLVTLKITGQAAFLKGGEKLGQFRNDYARIAPHINEELSNIGGGVSIGTSITSKDKMVSETQKALNHVESKLSTGDA